MAWPIGSLRRYGVNNVCFTIETGRYRTCEKCVLMFVWKEGEENSISHILTVNPHVHV